MRQQGVSMRIALFSGNYNYLREGANQALNRLVCYLQEEAGHVVRVYSPVTATPAFEPAGTLVPVPSVALPVRSEFRLGLGLPRLVRDDIRRFSADLFHIATPDILGTRAQTLAKRLGLPNVTSLHTRFETYPEHYRAGWIRPIVEAHLRRFYRRSDCVLVPTPALLGEMREIRGDDRVRIWSRGVDREQFSPARRDHCWRRQCGLSEDDVAILFFGRLVPEKGVDRYLSTVERLHRCGYRVRPLVVGAGPSAKRFEHLPGTVMTGHLEGSELATAVASADLLLNPSVTETFGNVLLEAMASGLAVASADAPNTRSLIIHGVTGMLCDPSDPNAYFSACAALIDSPERRRSLGTAAREASADYRWDAASRSVETAYREVLQAAGSPAGAV
jgi:phosphatidylinositol alpha 1,6-mannosyltransferase